MTTMAKIRPGRATKRSVSVWELLIWAFQVERVSIDFDELASVAGERPGVSMEYILMQRHNLGCNVDGGGRSEPHPDADLVASAVSCLHEGCGGRRMAITIAEHALAGTQPNWGRYIRPRCVPSAVRRHKHGRFAERSFWVGDGRVGRWPASQLGQDDGYVCLVTYEGTATEIAARRRDWLLWCAALREIRDTFRVGSGLTAFEVDGALPVLLPWKEG
ncbi:hypothetical protein FIU97_14695 [Roseivivax sp. THAF40]|uniref:hypothetical protein n=1 Tax=Roseivivax sp. THAF40 TaxID=2587858 RepID=UPI001267EBE7|nr:hypothetical protein [Roseivivax sp. THAF40]QFT47828.1 hypothetical protein FIU97_14695 [Roseivivax sp. THAF40]